MNAIVSAVKTIVSAAETVVLAVRKRVAYYMNITLALAKSLAHSALLTSPFRRKDDPLYSGLQNRLKETP